MMLAMSLTDTQIDVVAGVCAGIVSQLVSHPLDTVKVRLQIENR
jgi:ABC-type antimicrobial peptide transport system permease subunit